SNSAPTAANDGYTVVHDSRLSVSAESGVLANDADANGDPLFAVLVSGPTHGTLTLSLDGSFSYTPTATYSGSDSFTYQAGDGTAASATTTVTLTVQNDVPTANNDAFSVTPSGTTTIEAGLGVLANDTDAEDSLSALLVTSASHGTLTLNSNGSFDFTP